MIIRIPRSKKIVFFFPAFTSTEATAPLGILAIATPLLRAGYEVKLIDSTITPNFKRRVIDEMADAYVESIRAVQPRGPYALAGHSLGGVVAYEMARRLVARGEEVEWLGMIDSDLHHNTLTPGEQLRWYAWKAGMIPVDRGKGSAALSKMTARVRAELARGR